MFHNICALMKLNLKGTAGTEKVTKIEVAANEPLSGVFSIVDNKAVLGQNKNAGVLTLNCGEGATLSTEGTAFYIAIPDGSYTGLTFTVTSDGGTWEYKANENGNISVAANMLYESTQTPEFTPAVTYPGLCFTAVEANSSVKLTKKSSLQLPALETSTDGITWTDFTPEIIGGSVGTTITLANVSDKVYFRSKEAATSFSATSNYANFVMTGKIAASGNIMSLIDPSCSATTIPCDYCFRQLFKDCISLTAAPELPATAMKTSCYQDMFSGCKALTAAPALPAETLANNCYKGMFSGCEALETAPELLPAANLISNCYREMFSGCEALTAAPELNANAMSGSQCCMLMFSGCKALKTAPALPATAMKVSCYSEMFSGCKALTAAPALKAKNLANNCYEGMFSGCKALTAALALEATTLADNCYKGMFKDCEALVTAPALPATTMKTSCYEGMFSGCKALETAPELKASTLTENCFKEMFSGCSNLKYIKVNFKSWTMSSGKVVTTDWVKDVPTGGTFHCPRQLPNTGTANFNPNRIPVSWEVETF